MTRHAKRYRKLMYAMLTQLHADYHGNEEVSKKAHKTTHKIGIPNWNECKKNGITCYEDAFEYVAKTLGYDKQFEF